MVAYSVRVDAQDVAGELPRPRSTGQLRDAFATPAPFTFGNSARNILWGPGQMIFDVSLDKDTALNERVKLQFRAEAFNVPNHPSFGNPASNLSAPSTLGTITSTTVPARAIQLGLKLLF